MVTGNLRGENQRLYERLNDDGVFIDGETTYTLRNISVGGMQLQENLKSVKKPSDLISGRVGISKKGFRIYSDVICQVIDNNKEQGARLKFVDISEEFTEFLRSSTLRSTLQTEHKAGWIGSDSYQIFGSYDVESEKSPMKRLIRIETITGVVILAIALVLMIRASSQQSFWLIAQHNIQSPVSGEIASLHPDSEIAVGSVIANITTENLSGESLDLPIVSRVSGQTLNWNFNVGDQVVEEDILGVINLAPNNEGRIRAIISLKSPLLSLKPGDAIKVYNRAYHSMAANVVYSITPTQAANLTGVAADKFRFEEYYVIELNVPANASLAGQPTVDVFMTWMHRIALTLGFQ